ncbi:MAG: HNH endonuclease [Candidatus Nanopelagicales bacterium]
MARRPYEHSCWRKLRLTILERDRWQCQIKGPNCTQVAEHVDHIVAWESGGSWFDPINLQAACAKCNITKANQGRGDAWRRSDTRITLVCGPPGAGKSTYVQDRAKPGDLIVDYDLLGHALGSHDRAQHQVLHETINAARNAVLTKIRQGKTGADRVWIISTNPKAPVMFPHHDLVQLNPGLDVARQRAIDGGRTESAVALIDAWSGDMGSTSTASRSW